MPLNTEVFLDLPNDRPADGDRRWRQRCRSFLPSFLAAGDEKEHRK